MKIRDCLMSFMNFNKLTFQKSQFQFDRKFANTWMPVDILNSSYRNDDGMCLGSSIVIWIMKSAGRRLLICYNAKAEIRLTNNYGDLRTFEALGSEFWRQVHVHDLTPRRVFELSLSCWILAYKIFDVWPLAAKYALLFYVL